MNICFFERLGKNHDDDRKIFETNVNTVPSRKDEV